jgi:hypothetical protein
MIVNQTQNGWEVIYHRAHALLAAQLAGQWRRKDAPVRLYETIAAISHHDDLEKEWEENQLTEAGAPLDFTLDQSTQLDRLIKHTQNARYRGRWVALLISMHMSYLNEGKRGESEQLDRFLDEQKANQKEWINALEMTEDEAKAAYAFFQWCDRFSLILCQHDIPIGERALEIGKGPDGQRYDILLQGDGVLTVTPWCFEEDKFTVNIEAICLSQLQFKNNDELVQALQHAPIKTLEWTFQKSNES